MILIADSGSTKTDWIIINDSHQLLEPFTTRGLNPNIISAEEITGELKNVSDKIENANGINKILFYGSGCSGSGAEIMDNAIKNIFPYSEIKIKTDMYAAVQATCHDEEGIVCILGTGSNSCYYNGKDIIGDSINLGYILGDEGGGVYFGKRLLRDFFYGLLPTDLMEKFQSQYTPAREDVIENVYRKNAPNEYLASFLPFFKENLQHPYCNYFIHFGLEEFIKIHVWRFKNFNNIPVHFIGSVAIHFMEPLNEICKKLNITTGKIIRSPILDLAAYHLKQTEV